MPGHAGRRGQRVLSGLKGREPAPVLCPPVKMGTGVAARNPRTNRGLTRRPPKAAAWLGCRHSPGEPNVSGRATRAHGLEVGHPAGLAPRFSRVGLYAQRKFAAHLRSRPNRVEQGESGRLLADGLVVMGRRWLSPSAPLPSHQPPGRERRGSGSWTGHPDCGNRRR